MIPVMDWYLCQRLLSKYLPENWLLWQIIKFQKKKENYGVIPNKIEQMMNLLISFLSFFYINRRLWFYTEDILIEEPQSLIKKSK